mmetsp:Transcript_11931/g.20478  ORF Transcript_11931/g.20478 Transcript_11931/m.20478 type:complete len:208 (+) Transcript_11931:1273-1896(+)
MDVLLGAHMSGVVLANKHRGAVKVGLVVIEEQWLHVVRRVCGVETVGKPGLVHLGQIVFGLVANILWFLHGTPQLHHLTKSRFAGSFASRTLAEGEGRSEVYQVGFGVCFLFCIDHTVNGTHNGPAELIGLGNARNLEIWLVDHYDGLECSVVCPIFSKAVLQHTLVLFLDLRIAVKVRRHTVLGHLCVGIIAHPRNNLQTLHYSFI